MRSLHRRTIIAISGVVLAAAGWLWWIAGLVGPARESALKISGFALALITLLIGLVPRLLELGRRPAGARVRTVDELTELLAMAVGQQWRDAASERRLLAPAPIPVQ